MDQKEFDKKFVNLDDCVVSALELFIDKGVPSLNLGNSKKPLVVGSGNAAVTGRILLEGSDAIFADESTYEPKLKYADGVVLISASGKKHAVVIAKNLRDNHPGLEARLLTCNADAPSIEYFKPENVFVFPKQPEPYTYNTSTYMGMILGKTHEDTESILGFLKREIKPVVPKNLSEYDAYYMIVPEKFDNIREMFLTKFDELFCPMIPGRAFTSEQSKHAKSIAPNDNELFVSIGYNNKNFGKNRLNLPLPDKADYGAMMAVGYYFLGNVQRQNPSWFKFNIIDYCKKASELFGQNLEPFS
jgi:hypothetical protein